MKQAIGNNKYNNKCYAKFITYSEPIFDLI